MSLQLDSFSKKVTEELDRAVVQRTVTGFFADNQLRSKFVGAKTVLIPEMEVSGLGNYDRDDGFVRGSLTVTAKPYTLGMDRGRSFQLDREDNDESGVADLAGQVMGEFVRTQVVPELDAYTIARLASHAEGKSQTITGTPATGAFKMLAEAVGKVQNVVGYDDELVAFVNNAFWTALQTSTDVSRQLIISDFRKGDANIQVRSLNGVAILPVPDNRMYSAMYFNDGTTSGQEDGGFEPSEAAQKVGLLVLPKRGASLVKKTEQVRIFDPSQNINADAWKFDYRLYYDLFVKKSMEAAVYAYLYDATTPAK